MDHERLVELAALARKAISAISDLKNISTIE